MVPASVSHKLLKIGEVASHSGLPVKTVRYYEEIGLLTPNVGRSEAGYRLFDVSVLSRLDFIKRAKSLGLTLQEIREILAIRDQGQLPCDEVKLHLEAKVEAIYEQIEALTVLKDELQQILGHWQEHPTPGHNSPTICPNLQPDQ